MRVYWLLCQLLDNGTAINSSLSQRSCKVFASSTWTYNVTLGAMTNKRWASMDARYTRYMLLMWLKWEVLVAVRTVWMMTLQKTLSGAGRFHQETKGKSRSEDLSLFLPPADSWVPCCDSRAFGSPNILWRYRGREIWNTQGQDTRYKTDENLNNLLVHTVRSYLFFRSLKFDAMGGRYPKAEDRWKLFYRSSFRRKQHYLEGTDSLYGFVVLSVLGWVRLGWIGLGWVAKPKWVSEWVGG